MTTPLATIADALIEFILSLLRDPNAAAELESNPDGVLARNGLSGVCADDVRAVAPVIADHPSVSPKPLQSTPPSDSPTYPTPGQFSSPPTPVLQNVLNEIQMITQNLTIDSRSTIIDQSVNQTIWAEGDVNQIFDQETVLAAGDNSVAAGRDAGVDNSTTDVSAGDISIGNTDIDTEVTDSFNDSSTNTEVDVAAADSAGPDVEAAAVQAVEDATTTAASVVEVAPEPAPEPEPEPFEYESVSVDLNEPAPDFLDEEP